MPEIKNIKKAAERILQAVKDKERIILYGDADLDGAASVIILQETIQMVGIRYRPTVYFPDRQKEGYGINDMALKYLKKYSPALFIVLDTGISNVSEVELAKKLGFEVIIIDHHQALAQLPKASIIVDPKQKTDKYPFKHLACAGVVYKLSKEIKQIVTKSCDRRDLSQNLLVGWRPEKFLELVALATLYDQMPLEDENQKLVRDGILALKYTQRPGLKELASQPIPASIDEVRQKMISPLAAGQIKNHISQAYSLLIEKNPAKAKKLSQELIALAQEKKQQIKIIFSQVEAQMDNTQVIVFEGSSWWPVFLLGPVASRVCQRYKKPCFLYSLGKKQSRGGVRAPQGKDVVKAMNQCSGLLVTYGGHAPAAGFSIKNENLEKFKNCLIKYFSS